MFTLNEEEYNLCAQEFLDVIGAVDDEIIEKTNIGWIVNIISNSINNNKKR